MPGKSQSERSITSIADRLAAARRERFVGREEEREVFRSALHAEKRSFTVLFLYGPGGIGKTVLLQEYARMAQERGFSVIRLDGRNFGPSPEEFLQTLRLEMGLEETENPRETMARLSRFVLFIDTFEILAPLDNWLRESFLEQLPERCLIVIAGRTPPTPAWRSDLDWGSLTRIMSLRNLRPEESREFLTIRGIPEERHQDVLTFTHGHPLALSLAADVQKHSNSKFAFDPRQNPDIVQLLLERFLDQVPSPIHRHALEMCAHVRITTEALLAAVLGQETAPEIFAWLRGLSFVEQGPRGVFPHDLAREVLDADLRWRNPDAYQAMHFKVNNYFGSLLETARDKSKQSIMTDITYLYRYNPIVRSFYDWKDLGNASTELAKSSDEPVILEIVRHHEGSASAEIARYWFERQPEAFILFRNSESDLLGFMATLRLPAITASDAAADPAMITVQHFLQRFGPLRTDERLDYIRFWMGREIYQEAAMNNLVTMVAGTAFRKNDPNRAWTFAAVSDAEHWQPFFAHLNFAYTRDADFTVGEHTFGVFSHDWRLEPPPAWSKTVSQRQLATDGQWISQPASPPERLVVLSKPEFAEAVRDALRNYTRPTALFANPLLHSRLIVRKSKENPTPGELQKVLLEAANSLRGNPKDEKFYRAVWRTYFEPAPTQEQAAERLGLPFSTYRYHLTNGVDRIVESMWQGELYSFEG